MAFINVYRILQDAVHGVLVEKVRQWVKDRSKKKEKKNEPK